IDRYLFKHLSLALLSEAVQEQWLIVNFELHCISKVGNVSSNIFTTMLRTFETLMKLVHEQEAEPELTELVNIIDSTAIDKNLCMFALEASSKEVTKRYQNMFIENEQQAFEN
ncbi:hypothetical protein ACJX0J_035244, partial [Zea mays]